MNGEALQLTKLGLEARAQGRLVEALAFQRQAIAQSPDNWGILTNLGTALQDAGRLEEAIDAFAQASRLSNHPLPVTNLAMAWLRAGFFARGFYAFLARWRVAEWPQPAYGLPCPHALPGADRLPTRDLYSRQGSLTLPAGRLLILPDQGYGDFLMTLPFVRGLLSVRPDAVVLVKSPLLALARAALGDLSEQVSDACQGQFDAWLTGFDIPAFLPETLGDYGGERQMIEQHFRTAFGDAAAQIPTPHRVGVVWRGNPAHGLDRWRSAGPKVLGSALRGLPGTPVCLLPDVSDGECTDFAEVAGRAPERPEPTDFAATAQQLLSCSALFSVDTAVVHLAGLLGIPCRLLVNAFGDWRWGRQGEIVAWYPSVRACRQENPGDWSGLGCGLGLGIER